MNKIYILFLLVLSIFVQSQSPITLNSASFPGANDTLRFTNVQPGSVGNYTQTGTNFNWDFSNVVSTSSDRRDFKSAINTPYAFYYLSFTNPAYGEKIADTLIGGTGTISITNYYNFYRKQTTPFNAFIADGVGMSISNIPVASLYSDKDELYHLPMSYPKYDSTTFKFSTLTTTLLPIKYSKAGYRVTKVDGWGTVKTPFGTDNCLRIITTQYSIDTITINLPFPGLPPIKFGTPNFQRSYQWMTTTSKIPYFEVSGNLINNNFTPTTYRYRGVAIKSPPPPPPPPPNGVGISEIEDVSALEIYPNPVADKLWIAGKSIAPNKIEIYDINGKLLSTQHLEQFGEVAYFNTNDLSEGLYVAKVYSAQKPIIFKFVKQ